MKRAFIVCLIAALAIGSATVAFGQTGNLRNGFYFAEEDGFSQQGWKYVVTFEVRNGRIQNVDWNGANVKAGPSKDVLSKRGEYGMVERGGAQARWHVQAERMERWLEQNQNIRRLSLDNENRPDAISGVSIHVNEFQSLVMKAMEKGPVGRGDYRDGWYHAEATQFSHGWKDMVDLTVIGGRIVAAHWTAASEGGGADKYTASVNGDYGMVARGGAQARWYEQADKAARLLLERQDPAAVRVKSDGTTDAVSGVSITVGGFFELAEKALNQGPERA